MTSHDDAYVDVENILLTSHTWIDDPVSRLWWGRFRHNRQVPASGEGREMDYKAATYPKHACDGASVMGQDLARWIWRNKDMLHTFGVSGCCLFVVYSDFSRS